MEVSVLAVGRLKAGPERDLCDRYLDRARKSGRALGIRGFETVEIAESKAARAADRIAAEGAMLLAALPKGATAMCLDPAGDLLDSERFARLLSPSSTAVERVSFIIGGPDGLAADLLAAGSLKIAFGRVTWPHQLVRILLAEQLYRAMTILSGHPYHRA